MIISMKNLERLSIAEMEEFLRGSRKLALAADCQERVYLFLEGLLASQQYRKLKKRERGIVRRFGAKITGLSRGQVTRLIGHRKASGAAAPLCAALHRRRRGAAGRDRYGARGSVRACDPPHPASRVRRLW